MESTRPYVGEPQTRTGRDLLFDSEIPLLHGWSLHRGFHSPGRISRAGWRHARPAGKRRRSTGADGDKRGQRNIEKRHSAVVRREITQGIFQVILKLIVGPKSRPDRGLPFP